MNKIKWLMIANAVRAEVYAIEDGDYTLVTALSHADGRLKSSELVSDGSGHQFAPHSDAHEEEHRHFAKEVADFLDLSRQHNEYHALIICAGPHFHGLLNKAVTKSVQALVIKSIEKDYIPLPQDKKTAVIESIVHDSHHGG